MTRVLASIAGNLVGASLVLALYGHHYQLAYWAALTASGLIFASMVKILIKKEDV